MRRNCISVFVALILAGCMVLSGAFPMISSVATESETVASFALQQNLDLSAQGAVDFSWDAVENAASYVIETYDESVKNWVVLDDACTNTNKRIEGLDDSQTLFIRVSAKDSTGVVIACSEVFAAYTALSAPAVSSAVLAGDICTVTWEAVNGADGYVVYSDASTRIANVQTTQCAFALSELKDAKVFVTAYSYINGTLVESQMAACDVTAEGAETEMLTLGVGETFDFGTFAFGETTYLVADSAVVSLQESIAKAEKVGRTQIVVTTQAGACVITVQVVAAPSAVSFKETAVTMHIGESLAAELNYNAALSSGVSYESSDVNVVTVDENGILTALKAGNATVTATYYNDVAAEMAVTVADEKELYFEKATLKLGVGEKIANAVLSDGKAVAAVRYSGFGDVVSVAADGTVTALKTGTVELIATATDGREAKCTVTVIAAPTALTMTPAALTIGVGMENELTIAADADIDLSKAVWTVDNTDVVTLENNTIKAIAAGTATVTVTLYNDVSASCTVTVKAAPAQLKLNATAHTLFVGETHQLTASADKNAFLGSVTYTSSDTSILTVDAQGKVKTLKAGTASVTVKAYNGVTAVCTYTVKVTASKVTVKSSASVFAVGMYSRMTATTDTGTGLDNAVWEVSDTSIATLNEEKHLIGLKAGKVTVTVTLENGIKGSCTVTIQAAPTSISLNKTSLTLDIDGRERLYATVNSGAYSGLITFSSNKETVARVANDGTVIAVGAGTCKITARTFNGKTATCTVNVYTEPESIEFGYSSYSQTQGSWFYVTLYDQNDNKYLGATFTSSDTSVATVLSDGLVHVKKMGTATITARTPGGLSASCRINVSRIPVPLVSQLPNYPTGCEAASCAMLLRYYGYDYSTSDMVSIIPRQNIYYIDGYPIGPDINYCFVGDPRYTYTSANPGYGVFSPAVRNALQDAVDYDGGDHTAVRITGCSFDELLGYVADGYPVIVWSTYHMNVPSTVNAWYIIEDDGDWRYFSYPRGTHVTVLCGFDSSYIYMMDPYDDACLSYSKYTFEDRWDLLGNQGVILM